MRTFNSDLLYELIEKLKLYQVALGRSKVYTVVCGKYKKYPLVVVFKRKGSACHVSLESSQ